MRGNPPQDWVWVYVIQGKMNETEGHGSVLPPLCKLHPSPPISTSFPSTPSTSATLLVDGLTPIVVGSLSLSIELPGMLGWAVLFLHLIVLVWVAPFFA